ncbi:hypothetical protein TNCV_4558041 [Trichonephila clavipes]|nr:hypothetical protein TNCV_4558041 [Trichonephila clavipes]
MMPAHTMILHVGYRSFSGYFLDDKAVPLSLQISWRLQSDDRQTCSHLRIVRMPSPVQSNCEAHDTIANGQYGAVWSMGHTQQVVRIVLLPSNVWQQFFRRSAFPQAARN